MLPGNAARKVVALTISVLAAALAGGAISLAQQTPQSAKEIEKLERERELEILKDDLKRAEAINTKLKTEAEALRGDRVRLSQALTNTVARIREIETRLAAIERELAPLLKREAQLSASLQTQSAALEAALGALLRMNRQQSVALLLHPGDAVASARAALLLGEAAPVLREQASELTAQLAELSATRTKIDAERSTLTASRAELDLERRRLAALVAERQRAINANDAKLREQKNRALALSQQTGNVQDLVARMEREIEASTKAASANRETAIDPTLADPTLQDPAIPFAKTRGKLSLPVRGRILRENPSGTDPNPQSAGISIETSAGSDVIAPADGRVVFAGPFRGYGNLLILNVGGGYHVLLAGVGNFTVELGQFVRSGEPVAVMGPGPEAASRKEAKTPKSILYVEFRKDGESIDSGPWWLATDNQKARG